MRAMRKLKPQYEEFCRAYVTTSNAGQAAVDAGYSGANRYHQGAELLARPEIVARVRQLRAELAERESLHVESLLAKLEIAYAQAVHARNTIAIVRVIELQAKLAGLVGSTGTRRDESAKTIDAAAEIDALLAQTEPKQTEPKKPPEKPKAPRAPRVVAQAVEAEIVSAPTGSDVLAIQPDELPVTDVPQESGAKDANGEPASEPPPDDYKQGDAQRSKTLRLALEAVARARTRKRLSLR
jgi:phage terminase small subunit